MRRAARRALPSAVRWRLRNAVRTLGDTRAGIRFATHREPSPRAFELARYERPLRCYAGQERDFEAKRRNIALALDAVDGTIVEPGATFSFWQCVGRPSAARGYAPAAALKDGVLTKDVGGALCLASTLLFNIGLLAGMSITERRSHSVDTYGEDRYFELGRDAAVEFAYTDLRFRNDLPCAIRFAATTGVRRALAVATSQQPLGLDVRIDHAPPQPTADNSRITIENRRRAYLDGMLMISDRWESAYAVGAPLASRRCHT